MAKAPKDDPAPADDDKEAVKADKEAEKADKGPEKAETIEEQGIDPRTPYPSADDGKEGE